MDQPIRYRALLELAQRYGVYEDPRRGKGSERLWIRLLPDGSKRSIPVTCHSTGDVVGVGLVKRPDMSLFRFVQWISEGRPVTVYGDGLSGCEPETTLRCVEAVLAQGRAWQPPAEYLEADVSSKAVKIVLGYRYPGQG